MQMSPLRRLGTWLPPLAVMAVIFALSAQPSLDSGLGVVDLVGRKLVHFAVYALLCLLWWRAFVTVTGPGRAALAAFLLASAYAVSDEVHQSFVEGRSASALDWAIDTAGAAVVAIRVRSRRSVLA
jgi:VanZ family protein